MIRSLFLSIALACAMPFASAQERPIAMELRQIITIEIDSTVIQSSMEDPNKIFKVLHPFADQKTIWQDYYVVNNTPKDAYIRKNEITLIPLL